MELAKKATKYIQENADKVIPIYRSRFHMEPTIGWMNDPNGLIYVDGEFHLFYQANPYEAKNENMAWGHFISSDLIKYREVDVALYPEISKGETGCFTGSAFIENNELKLVYTRHLDVTDKKCEENQYICTTKDKIHFEKGELPCVDPNELPEEIDHQEFRDPQIFYRNGICYLIIGGHTVEQKGVFLIFSGKDSSSLHFDFYFGPYENTYNMVECPSFIQVDGQDVIIYSTYGMVRENNSYIMSHSVFYILGQFVPEEKAFIVKGEGKIDRGDSFYAPKTIEGLSTPTMIGWMENWNKIYKTAVFNHNWVGSFSFPRVLKIKDNMLYQEMYPTISNYIVNETKVNDGGIVPIYSLNEFSFDSDFMLTLRRENGRIKIFKKDDIIYVDMLRTNNLHEMIFSSNYEYKKGKVSFLLDTSSIEVFIDDGKETFTSRFYLHGEHFEIENENCHDLVSKRIEVL